MNSGNNDPDKTDQNLDQQGSQKSGDPNSSTPNPPEPPNDSSELYQVSDTEGSQEPLTDRMIQWQSPKEGYIAPPSDGNASAYETGSSAAGGASVPSIEELRWQMPKEEHRASSDTPEGELYQTSSQESPQEVTQQARSWQINSGEVLASSGSSEVYGLKDGGTPANEQPAPDLQVLFADTKYNSDDVYGISSSENASDGSSSVPPSDNTVDNDTGNGANGDADSDKRAPVLNDIYGVSAPTEKFYSREVKEGRRTFEDPDEKYADTIGRAEYEGALSVETLYDRRMNQDRQRMFADDPEPDGETAEPRHPERPKLPSYPFSRGILRPFFCPSFVLRIAMLAFAALVPFYPGIWHFSRHIADIKMASVHGAVETENPQGTSEAEGPVSHWKRLLELPTVNSFLGILFEDRLWLFFVSLIWGVFAIPYLLQVFSVTAAGDDRIEEWPDGGLLNGIVQFFWTAVLVLVAGIPGWLLLRPFDWEEVGFITGTIFLTPVFFLSSMESGTPFTLVTKGVLKSVITVRRYWRRFFIISVLMFLLGAVTFGGILWYVLEDVGTRQLRVIIATVLSALLFSFLPTIYLRYLGRLAWIIQDADRDKKSSSEIEFTADEEVIYIDETYTPPKTRFQGYGNH